MSKFEPGDSQYDGKFAALSVQVTHEMFERFARASKARGLSKSELLRRMVEHCLTDMGYARINPPSPKNPLES